MPLGGRQREELAGFVIQAPHLRREVSEEAGTRRPLTGHVPPPSLLQTVYTGKRSPQVDNDRPSEVWTPCWATQLTTALGQGAGQGGHYEC